MSEGVRMMNDVTLAPEQARLMDTADRLLAQTRAEGRGTLLHRSLRRLEVGPRTVVEMVAVALLAAADPLVVRAAGRAARAGGPGGAPGVDAR